MRRGTCCKSRCEQSTVWPVHVQTRGHFWSMLLVPLPPPPPTFVFAKFVPCTKMPTLPTLLNVPNDESPFPYGINCNSKITKLVVVAFTTQLSGGFFIFDIISHIWLLASIVIWMWMCADVDFSLCSFSAALFVCSLQSLPLSLQIDKMKIQIHEHTLAHPQYTITRKSEWILRIYTIFCFALFSDVSLFNGFLLFDAVQIYNGFDHLIVLLHQFRFCCLFTSNSFK